MTSEAARRLLVRIASSLVSHDTPNATTATASSQNTGENFNNSALPGSSFTTVHAATQARIV
ncbi:hypothetical protein GCM10027430_31900 [Lysobacter tyrosinilyticus]